MEIIRCSSGHFYDAERYESCPTCAREAGRSPQISFAKSAILQGFSQPELIASGSYGSVYRVSKDEKEYALKVIDCGNDQVKLDLANNEIRMMKELTGSNQVVRLLDSDILRQYSNTTVLLLEEYVTSFEIYYKTHPITPENILLLGIDICNALDFCWMAGVAHLDVQPKNLFVRDNGQFILGDFGSSVSTVCLSQEKQLRGTLSYMAPEVYEKQSYSQASDIYSLGMVLYCLLNHGNLPFLECGSKEKAVMDRLTQKLPVPPLPLDSQLNQLLQRALAVEPGQRYSSFRDMSQALQEVRNQILSQFKITCQSAPAKSSASGFLAQLLNRSGKKKQSRPEAPPQPIPIPGAIGTLFDSDTLARALPLHSSGRSPAYSGFSSHTAQSSGMLFDPEPALPICMPSSFPSMGECVPCDYSSGPVGGTLFDSDQFACTCVMPSPHIGCAEPEDSEVRSYRTAGTSAPRMSQVQFSAVAPKEARKEDYSIIQLFMYEQAFRAVVEEAIAMADSPVQEKRSGFQRVQEYTRVKIVLTCPDMTIDDNVQEQIWYGGYLQFDFAICPPEDFKKRQILLTAAVYFNDVPATRLMLTVKALASYEEEIELARQDIVTAFVSYASQDRTRVGALVQGMRKARPDMDIFFDVMTLRSGQDWENTLYREILRRDILFLCWSRNAMASEWVEREWQYALQNKGIDCIEPIPLEHPDLCPPPRELWNKHFNDNLLYIINR